MDQRLVELVAAHHREHTDQDLRRSPAAAAVRDRCEAAKRTLSVAQTVAVEVTEEVPPCRVSRAAYEAAIEPELALADAVIRDALAAAELGVAAVDRVVLCGGASRTPAVQAAAGGGPLQGHGGAVVVDPCPDEVVAIGACVAHPTHRASRGLHRPRRGGDRGAGATVGIRTGFDTMHPVVPAAARCRSPPPSSWSRRTR